MSSKYSQIQHSFQIHYFLINFPLFKIMLLFINADLPLLIVQSLLSIFYSTCLVCVCVCVCVCVRVYRLYKSLGDFDAVRGIFSSHVGTKSVTQGAMEAEERGDYMAALHEYKEVRELVENRVISHACMRTHTCTIKMTLSSLSRL